MTTESLSIGEEEFQRLQAQLIELRTTNYQLKESNAKQAAELTQLQEAFNLQTRDLEKANKAVQKSKKAKEFTMLLEENENLQKKIEAQENDFKLQNKTLMEEITHLTDQRDMLDTELSQATKMDKKVDDDEYRRLQAENAALKKSLGGHNQLLTRDTIDGLFDKLKHMFPASSGTAMDDTTPHNVSNEESNCLRQLETIKEDFVKTVAVSDPSLNATTNTTTYAGEEMVGVQELQLKLSTNEEEKRIIKEQLKMAQEAAQVEIQQLKKEVDKWTEKARRKQDSYTQLQEEKEAQYQQQKNCFEEMIRSRDAEVKTLKESLLVAQESLSKASHENAVSEEATLELKTLRDENERLKSSVLIVSQEAQTTQEVLNKSVGELMEKNSQLAADKIQSDKLAESRKNLLDEMSKEHQENLKSVEKRHESALDDLREQLNHEKAHVNQLSTKCGDLEQQLQRLQSLADKIASYEQQLEEAQKEMSKFKQQTDERISQMETDHQNELKELNNQLTGCQAEIEANKKLIPELEMVKHDKEAEIKIVEKKTSGLIRDLRRQVQQMQRKEEKLQQQLSSIRLKDDVMLSVKREISHDTSSQHSRDSSISSLRAITGDGNSNMDSSSQEEPLSVEESRELMGRVAQLQLEKATLEEKVSHLENTGSALAEDVMQKSAIIHQYFMENKADHEQMDRSPRHGSTVSQMVSPLKLVQRIKSGGGSESLQETNRKMQRALEEALMKNIHLQKNIDMLSSQLQEQTTGLKDVPSNISS